ncbi:hypothetical protein G9A89_020325 [Geosiphon pyriformis]|nr:hypothetical protein G9A89_020325 [Geosiphon pyriformis]
MAYHPAVEHWVVEANNKLKRIYLEDRRKNFITWEHMDLMQEIVSVGTPDNLYDVMKEFLTRCQKLRYDQSFHTSQTKLRNFLSETILKLKVSSNCVPEIMQEIEIDTFPSQRCPSIDQYDWGHQRFATNLGAFDTPSSVHHAQESSSSRLFGSSEPFTMSSGLKTMVEGKTPITLYDERPSNQFQLYPLSGSPRNNSHIFANNSKTSLWYAPGNARLEWSPNHLEHLSRLEYYKTFEIARYMKPFGKLDGNLINWDALIKIPLTEIHDIMINWYKKYLHKDPQPIYNVLPKRSSRYITNSSNIKSSIILSATLEWKGHAPAQLTLNPLKRGPSKRIFRKYGADRFLSLKLDADTQKFGKEDRERLEKLLLTPINLMGRIFEFFYGKENTIFYFATKGRELDSVTICELINWHIPLEETNLGLPVSKFVSRIALCLSDTIPTILFEPHQIRLVYDETSPDGTCMTDGCGMISLGAMERIAEILSLKPTPCAIQARIGATKGIWFLDHEMKKSSEIWIECRESQVKYDISLGTESRDSDSNLRTLDVVKVIKSPSFAGTLNAQYIRALHCGGVKEEVFLELVKEQIENVKSQVVDRNEMAVLIKWLEGTGNTMALRLSEDRHAKVFEDSFSDVISNSSEDFAEGPISSGYPNNRYELCIQMLQAGFIPSQCPYLAKELTSIVQIVLRTLTSKYRIQVPLSRVLTCIADPTKTLRPGEIFIQLDERAGLDNHGNRFGVIEGDVLVTRTPCLLPSDMYKAKAVLNPKLIRYFNLVIFPIQSIPGEGSLASRLSGGDYDGDTIFCCWEPRIVDRFHNSPVIEIQENVKKGISQEKIKVSDILKGNENPSLVFQRHCLNIHLNDLSKKLNLFNHFHDLWSDFYGLNNTHSIYLAQMCGKLVDATKQGLSVTEEVFLQDQNKLRNCPTPIWVYERSLHKKRKKNKEKSLEVSDEPPPAKINKKGFMNELLKNMRELLHEVNYSHFTVAPNVENALDTDITRFHELEFEKAARIKRDTGIGDYLEDLENIEVSIQILEETFRKTYSGILQPRIPGTNVDSTSLSRNEEILAADQEFLQHLIENPNPNTYLSEKFRYMDHNIGSPDFNFLIQLKASILYTVSFSHSPTKKCCWKLALRAICNIKTLKLGTLKEPSRQHGPIGGSRTFTEDAWKTHRLDGRWVRN